MESKLDNLAFDRAELIWNIQGRLGRWLWFKYTYIYPFLFFLGLFFFILLLGVATSIVFELNEISEEGYIALIIIACIVLCPIIITYNIIVVFLTIKRLHDIGFSGWWYLLMVVLGWVLAFNNFLYIVYSLLFFSVFAFVSGKKAPNKYGDKPVERLRFFYNKI